MEALNYSSRVNFYIAGATPTLGAGKNTYNSYQLLPQKLFLKPLNER